MNARQIIEDAAKANPFPESKVQQLVYHGTGERFRRFRKGTQGIIWFTSDRDRILRKDVGAQGHGYIVSLYVDIRNPADWKQYDQLLLAQFKGMKLDGAILPYDGGRQFDGFVFDPAQTKIVSVDPV